MLQDMLSAKDETIVKLTNQIFEMENNNTDGQGDGGGFASSGSSQSGPVRQSLLMADAKELETLRVRWKWFFFFGKALCPF
jgi:hypothetical protein